MRKIIPLLLFIPLLLTGPVRGQNLRLPISNYTNKAYGKSYEATNYCIVTDHRNFVYAGNANGILEYDGSQWRFIPVRQGAYVTSLMVSPEGIIFVGSQQEFGFLEPDQNGSLTYRSLSGQLPEMDRFFSTVWSIHTGKNFTAFQSQECLYILEDDSLRPIYPETSFHTSYLVDNKLFVRERDSGLKILEGNRFVPLKDGKLFADLGVFGMFTYDEQGEILIVTNEKGFYLFDPSGGIERMSTENDNFLIQAGIFGGIALRDSHIALKTMHQGVIICTRDGEIASVINKNSGLQENDVKGLWQDTRQNIWCALSKGISKIDYSSPVSFYHENAGLVGSVYSVIRHEGKLYVGTTSGLYVEDKSDVINKPLEFIPWPGIRDQVWSLKSIRDQLVVGTGNGLYVIRNGTAGIISHEHSFALCYLEESDVLLAGGSGGLSAFSPSGNWKRAGSFADINADVKSIAINHSGYYDATEIWLGTSLQGTLKVLLNPDLSCEFSHYYGTSDGLPEDWVLPFAHGDSIIFGTRNGIMHFVDEQILRTLLPDSMKDKPENYRGIFEPGDIYGEKNTLPLSFAVDVPQHTWAIIDNEITLVNHDKPGEPIVKPFFSIDLGELNYIYPDGENTVWFGASEGLARFDLKYLEKPAGKFHAAVRSVTVTGDSMVFYGAHQLPEDYSPAEPWVLFEQPGSAVPVLDYNYNDLTFYFTSPYYENEGNNLFSWKLEGSKSDWTGWSGRKVTGYSNLREGDYNFRVRVKNIYGDTSEPAGYRFIIRPPWFRTIPAYIAYIIILSLFVYAAVLLGQLRLRKKNERLEAIVLERTEEIRHQNIVLAAQKKEITDSIYYAERIQRAILPHTEKIGRQVEGYFILFKPKDIVSGDFYWLAENRDKIIVTAADCTGHGVPGAFMSMLGISFLNKIILENNITQADLILNKLRDNVISALKQTGQEGEARDGMDMSLVVIDLNNMTLEFAGANNPLYMIREDELSVTRADRMPVAYYLETGNFSNHTIRLKKGDTFYLFSDGYADQFGGPRGKKFMYKPFKNLLLENRDKSMEEIHRILEYQIESWKAPGGPDREVYEQVDDILVIGVRI